MKPTHLHADGGLYTLEEPQSGKHPVTGEWVKGVAYRGEDGKLRWTDRERWDSRFKALPESHEVQDQAIQVRDDDHEVIAEMHFHVEQAGDIRSMLISAAKTANTKRNSGLERVLKAQAEMISQGLHLRDHDFPDYMGDVSAFHAKFGQEYLGKPRMLPRDLHDFREKFHTEETQEYRDEYARLTDAINRKDRRDIINSLELQLDALCDSIWVLLGTADLQFGRAPFNEAWKRVVKANMSKIRKDQATEGHKDSGREAKYDVVKPAGWEAPDHRDLVADNAIFDEIFGITDAVEGGWD